METIVTPTALTPGMLSVGSGYTPNVGPSWSSFSGSEAQLFGAAAHARNAFGAHADANFLSNQISNTAAFAELRQLVVSSGAQYIVLVQQLAEVKQSMRDQVNATEVALLRGKLDDANQAKQTADLIAALRGAFTVNATC